MKLFSNAGPKIQYAAVVLFILEVIGSVILGMGLGRDRFGDLNAGCFFIIVFGVILSYVSSVVIYGFGELVESVANQSGHLKSTPNHMNHVEKKERIEREPQKISEVLKEHLIEKTDSK